MCLAPNVATRRTRNLAAGLCFVSMMSLSVTMPYSQVKRDALECTSLCIGGMTSLRNALSLVGAPLVGRLSDAQGRRPALVLAIVAGVASSLLLAAASSIRGLWLATVPAALLSHQFDSLKALLTDAYRGYDDAQLAGAQGTLGMAAGAGFVGVVAGGFVKTPAALAGAACAGAALSLVATALLPSASQRAKSSSGSTLWSLVSLPAARSPAGLLLLAIRSLMGLAFHVFMAVWQPSLKARFPWFAAADHARFMSFVGIGYAVSQGFIAQPLLRRVSHAPLLVLCCFVLASSRIVALTTTALPVVYAAYGPAIVALGVLNAAIAAAVAKVAPSSQRGGFFGVLSAVESVCGIVGPGIGGVLAVATNAVAVCGLVVLLYVIAAFLLLRFWPTLLVDPQKKTS